MYLYDMYNTNLLIICICLCYRLFSPRSFRLQSCEACKTPEMAPITKKAAQRLRLLGVSKYLPIKGPKTNPSVSRADRFFNGVK